MFTGAIRKIAAAIVGIVCALGLSSCRTSESLYIDGACQDATVDWGHDNVRYDRLLKDVFDFEAGKSYPLQLGSQTTGVQGSFYSGFFATYGSISGGPDVTVTFVQDNRRWPVSIPRNKVIFEVVPQLSDTSVTLNVEGLQRETHFMHLWMHEDEIVSLCDSGQPEVDLSSLTLGKTLSDRVASATIKLTAEQYAQLVGTIDPAAKTPTE